MLAAMRSSASFHVASRQARVAARAHERVEQALGIADDLARGLAADAEKALAIGVVGVARTPRSRSPSTSTSIPQSVGWQFMGHIVRMTRRVEPATGVTRSVYGIGATQGKHGKHGASPFRGSPLSSRLEELGQREHEILLGLGLVALEAALDIGPRISGSVG